MDTPDAEPPPYDSMYGQLKRAKVESGGNLEFVRRATALILCNTACNIITIIMFLAIPITMIIIGSIHLDDCPRERFIPIYLIVAGAFGLFTAMVKILSACLKRCRRDSDEEEEPKPNPLATLINCFLFAWFIAGCVWVYRIYPDYQSDDPAQPRYCSATVYLFTFWLLNTTFIIFGLGIICCCVSCSFFCCCVKE